MRHFLQNEKLQTLLKRKPCKGKMFIHIQPSKRLVNLLDLSFKFELQLIKNSAVYLNVKLSYRNC